MSSERIHTPSRRSFRIAIAVGTLAVVIFLLRSVLSDALIVLFGASVIAFLIEPLAFLYEKRLSRNTSALLALLSVSLGLIVVLALLLPSIFRQIQDLTDSLPVSFGILREWCGTVVTRLENSLPGLKISFPPLNHPPFAELAAGTLHLAGSVAGFAYRFSLMVVLSYFLLCDREKLLIRLELLIPQTLRKTAVRMGNAVCRELRLYLRGQAMISTAVGILSAIGLAAVGVPSFLVLGGLVGILNMIPYFGPFLGGIPAVLIAMSVGWRTALFAAAALWIVQQLDSTFISPRIMSGLTGLSPGVVLIAIFIGSHFSGIVGMLLALPLIMAIRTVFRVFVQRHENV